VTGCDDHGRGVVDLDPLAAGFADDQPGGRQRVIRTHVDDDGSRRVLEDHPGLGRPVVKEEAVAIDPVHEAADADSPATVLGQRAEVDQDRTGVGAISS
jgi:hypothetical protein